MTNDRPSPAMPLADRCGCDPQTVMMFRMFGMLGTILLIMFFMPMFWNWLSNGPENTLVLPRVNDNEHGTQVRTDCTKTQVPTVYTTVHVGTVNQDGHKWVVSSEGGVVHHPDCSCHKVGEKP